MGYITDLLGTFSNTFKIGKAKATIDASGLTAARTHTLKDSAGTLAHLSDTTWNRVHNGDNRVQQRPTVTPTNAYQYGPADRHMIQISGGTSISGTINIGTVAGFSSGYGYGVNTGSWTTGNFKYQHRIASANTYDLSSKTITVACKVWQTTGGARNFKIDLSKPTTTIDTFSAQTVLQTSAATSVPDTTVTQLSATFTLGSTDAALGLSITVYDSDAANTVATKYYMVGDLWCGIGSVAPAYEMRPYEFELDLCLAYYFRLTPGTVAYSFGSLSVVSATASAVLVTFPRAMRSAPTALEQNGTAADYGVAVAGVLTACSTVPTHTSATINVGRILFTVAAGLTAGQAGLGRAGSTSAYFGWSVDL